MNDIIQDKIISKTFKNSFKNGHLVFDKIEVKSNNINFSDFNIIEEIVKNIRFATNIYIVLNEKCLARRIVEELVWVGKYISNNVIVCTKELKQRYSEISNKIIIDPTVKCNLITIEKDGIMTSYFFDDNYHRLETNDLYNSYFRAIKSNVILPQVIKNIDKADEIYLFNASKTFNDIEISIIDYCEKQNKKAMVILNEFAYSIDKYKYFCNKNSQLVVVNKLFENNLILFEKNDKFYKVNLVNNVVFSLEISGVSFSKYFDKNIYRLSKLPLILDVSLIGNEKYIFNDNKFNKLEIMDMLIIKKNIMASTFEKFEEEEFDTTFYSLHNDYYDYESVKFITTLSPLLLSSKFQISAKYDKLLHYVLELRSFYRAENVLVKICRRNILDKVHKNTFISSLDKQIECLMGYFNICRGRDFDLNCLKIMSKLQEEKELFIDKILEESKILLKNKSISNYDPKSNRIIGEIKQKNEQIKENKLKINDPNENKARAKRRICNLKDEINTLEHLLEKQKQIIESLVVDEQKQFGIIMKNMLLDIKEKNVVIKESDSIDKKSNSFGRVLPQQKTKIKSNETEKDIFIFVRYLQKMLEMIMQFQREIIELDLPETGILFKDENNKNILAIKFWQQVEKAKIETKKYNAQLVVER